MAQGVRVKVYPYQCQRCGRFVTAKDAHAVYLVDEGCYDADPECGPGRGCRIEDQPQRCPEHLGRVTAAQLDRAGTD